MQQDFDQNYPELGIEIVGINEAGQESGNSLITETLPWLQDDDTNNDGESDVWMLWEAEWRDLTIVDRNNVPITTFNLTTFDLADPDNYAEVRNAFLDAAAPNDSAEGEPRNTDHAFATIDRWL